MILDIFDAVSYFICVHILVFSSFLYIIQFRFHLKLMISFSVSTICFSFFHIFTERWIHKLQSVFGHSDTILSQKTLEKNYTCAEELPRANCICRARTGIYHKGIEMKKFLSYFFATIPGWNSAFCTAALLPFRLKLRLWNSLVDSLFSEITPFFLLRRISRFML